MVAGGRPYLEVLGSVHAALRPRCYLEIGVRHGHSLALAADEAIGVDPAPRLTVALSARTTIFQETSDQFFRDRAKTTLAGGVDLAFIDGMHLFEYALRDFMNIEQHAHPAAVIVFDNIFPNHPLQAARERQTNVWTGDVWKIAACLRKYRPDLLLLQLSSAPPAYCWSPDSTQTIGCCGIRTTRLWPSLHATIRARCHETYWTAPVRSTRMTRV